jgi:hypothetical protein
VRNDQKALADIYYRIITESSGRKVIKGSVDLSSLYLKELPEWLSDVEVEAHFFCDKNKLTTLAGAPETVGGTFYCCNNKLTTLQGAPKTVRGDFSCYDNPGNFTEEDVRAVSRVDRNVYVML